MKVASVVLFLLVASAGCASTTKAMKEMSAGTCQAKCHEEHPDSLYDENLCLETLCTPPPS